MHSQTQANSFVSENASSAPLASAMAKRTASEAAAVTRTQEYVTTPLDEFDISKLDVSVRTKKDGSKTVICTYDLQKLTLMMTPGKAWAVMPFRVMEPYAGCDPTSEYEAYSASVAVDGHADSLLQQIDKKIIEACKDLAKDLNWHSSVKDDLYRRFLSSMLIVRAANADHLTRCKVRPIGQKGLVDACGKEQLDGLLAANSRFVGAKVKYAVSLHNVWFQKDAYGITWRLTNLVADCKDVEPPLRMVIGDCFADVTFSDEGENE
jgi:hypothetical protein